MSISSIGGEVRWNALGDLQLASGYSVYLATDSRGSDRSLLGTAVVGTSSLVVPQARGSARAEAYAFSQGTLMTLNFTHVVIYVECGDQENTKRNSKTIWREVFT